MRIVSGIRPSGQLTIANYLGAIKQFIELQEKHEGYFFIADLHAITTPYEPKELKNAVLSAFALYLALGLDSEKSTIFLQSQLPEHSELAWILETIAPLGELERMTQYKEKKQEGSPANAGLFLYPVLMAADILLYKPQAVPVGEDQIQHVEMTRSLAEKFNSKFGNVFPLPEPLVLGKNSARIKSLQNPDKKMSKSDEDPDGAILLLDSPQEIKRKIKKAVTDSGKEIVFDLKKKPAVANLLTIFSGYSGKEIKQLEKEFSGKTYAEFKNSLAELLTEKLKPIKTEFERLMKDESFLIRLLTQGSAKAQKVASKTLEEVKEKTGLTLK
ncbi:MAG: Tryptophan-tRNA ligase [Parcubacteria group bacterium GW2011_GWC1_45_9]|nr:MAG: Tryptophan-tRNA ligase [Parcubacteria group bacterium GW2011_GWA1_Parcubacteria_45_10]KKU17400.1 MAG: Tryptophan-tRNA ligase [Parcubacteria group bacterium GW2011_GWC1_45_9]HCI05524.1 tryptophan--tRNA ligase [Patescibacteria group bacterium]